MKKPILSKILYICNAISNLNQFHWQLDELVVKFNMLIAIFLNSGASVHKIIKIVLANLWIKFVNNFVVIIIIIIFFYLCI